MICSHNLIPRAGHQEEDTDEDEDEDEKVPDDFDDEDEDVAKVEDEPEGEEVDAEVIEFDGNADVADNPPVPPSPSRVPDPTTFLSARLTTFEERVSTMHEEQRKFLEERVTSIQEEQRKFFEDMRTFMTTCFPPTP
ncbi:hypothetical protein CJ030_MR6G022461 [Morella rubra]|uniref:Uncharacterized protein n=1 Tax=Morella rubra TaxID=262757 RepID=A0A6A1VFN4_9ROSI|nr:hypothetical protein CJ030_MR6G022461 [Morella rubra]